MFVKCVMFSHCKYEVFLKYVNAILTWKEKKEKLYIFVENGIFI